MTHKATSYLTLLSAPVIVLRFVGQFLDIPQHFKHHIRKSLNNSGS